MRIAQLAGMLAHKLDRRGRSRFRENCRHILGAATPQLALEAMVRRLFIHFATNYADLLRVPVLRRRVVVLADSDCRWLDRALSRKRGAVLVTGHVGNWDLAGTIVAAMGYPISAVYEPVPRGWAGAFNRYRSATQLEAIPMHDHDRIGQALKRGRVLALVADRDLTGRGALCPAFDAWRSFPNGPAAYALRYDVPLLVGWMVFQQAPGRPPYRVHIEPLEFVSTGDMSADVPALTRLVAARINRLIGEYPDQWLVFNPGWREKP